LILGSKGYLGQHRRRVFWEYPEIAALVPYEAKLPYTFTLPGIKPGVPTTLRLVRALLANTPIIVEIRSTVALDLQSQPLEVAIAKFREVVAQDETPDEKTMSLADQFKRMTLSDAQVVNFDAVQVIQRRLATIPTEVIGRCRVYLKDPMSQESMLNSWLFRAGVTDQRNLVDSCSHNLVVYHRTSTQYIGSHGQWSAIQHNILRY
jgi:hypothetical protein